MECVFCKKTLSSNRSLIIHQKSAKYCLDIQRGLSEEISPGVPRSACPGCKKMVRQDYFRRHQDICKALKEKNRNTEIQQILAEKDTKVQQALTEKDLQVQKVLAEKDVEMQQALAEKDAEMKKILIEKDRELEASRQDRVKLEQKIEKYESQMFEMARQPKTTQNVSSKVVVNFPPMTQQHLEDNAQHLSIDHIKRGMKGYAQYALEYPLKGMVTCTDYARRKIKYNDENGDVLVDPEMKQLRKKLFSAIRGRNQSLVNEHVQELQARASSGEWDRLHIQDLMQEVIDINRSVGSAAMGDSTDEVAIFIKEICMGLARPDNEVGYVTRGT